MNAGNDIHAHIFFFLISCSDIYIITYILPVENLILYSIYL
uniref:Uncharacterized protein n=1 Tax=Siphoviridae sp. ctZHD14 TaxID=2827891 RepID=A0A8S5SW91_9CAUD|nr:MAG TPA: hypothetical protein [Siphoviridae sp. ctZHD14]